MSAFSFFSKLCLRLLLSIWNLQHSITLLTQLPPAAMQFEAHIPDCVAATMNHHLKFNLQDETELAYSNNPLPSTHRCCTCHLPSDTTAAESRTSAPKTLVSSFPTPVKWLIQIIKIVLCLFNLPAQLCILEQTGILIIINCQLLKLCHPTSGL